MITVFFTNGHSAQIKEASSVETETSAADRPPQVKCLDSAGKVVARFRADHVARYTIDSER